MEKEQYIKNESMSDCEKQKIRYRLSEGLKIRKVAGQTMIIPIGTAVKTISQTAILNSEAAFMVSQMKGWFTSEEIVQKGMDVYEVNEDRLRADVMKLIESLLRSGMLIEEIDNGRSKRGRIAGTVRVSAGEDLPDSGEF